MSGNRYDPATGDQCGNPHPDHPEQGCHREPLHSPHVIDRDGTRLIWLDTYTGAGRSTLTWSLPPEPGPEVTAVRDRDGRIYEPTDLRYPHSGERKWRYWHALSEGWAHIPWRSMLANYSPFTDASAEATS